MCAYGIVHRSAALTATGEAASAPHLVPPLRLAWAASILVLHASVIHLGLPTLQPPGSRGPPAGSCYSSTLA
jgi:hypothetical protein